MSKKPTSDKIKMSNKDAIAAIKAAAAAQAQKTQPVGVTPASEQIPGQPYDFKKSHLHIGIPC